MLRVVDYGVSVAARSDWPGRPAGGPPKATLGGRPGASGEQRSAARGEGVRYNLVTSRHERTLHGRRCGRFERATRGAGGTAHRRRACALGKPGLRHLHDAVGRAGSASGRAAAGRGRRHGPSPRRRPGIPNPRRRNVLQRSMGVSEQVEIDVRGPFPLQEGDVFVLCSDGLHGVVKEDEIREVAGKPVREAADELIRRAIERGAPDNVTVIVARVRRASDVGDDTLVDGETRLDETQRSTAKIAAYDEKVMEEPGTPDVPPPVTPAASSDPAETAPAPTAPGEKPAGAASPREVPGPERAGAADPGAA